MTFTRTRVRRQRPRSQGSWTPAFDYVVTLLGLLLLLYITSSPTSHPVKIDTLGVYAVTLSWPDGSNDDLDLWVQDPNGNIAWFAQQDAGLMHLESDDLGTRISGTDGPVTVKQNQERTVIKGAVPGEYTVNVHFYNKADPGPITCVLRLWELRGQDRLLITRTITLTRQGEEVTAFRFTLDRAGNAGSFNRIPKSLTTLEGVERG